MKQPLPHPAFELLDQRRHDLGVGGADHLGCRKHLRLRLERHLAQIGLDLVAESQIQSPVDPGHTAFTGSELVAIRLRSLRVSARAMSRNTADTSWSLDSKWR